jgi:hypothetical protein
MSKAIKTGIPAVNVTLLETGASADNLRRMARGEVTLGMTGTDVGMQAREGKGSFAGKSIDDLVAVFAYDVSVLNIAVAQDAKIGSLGELAGRKFSPGMRGSAGEIVSRQVFSALGIEPQLVSGSLKDAAEGVQNRQLVGFAKFGPGTGVDAVLRETMVSTPLRLLGLDAEQQAKVSAAIPGIAFAQMPNLVAGLPPVVLPSTLVVYGTRRSLMNDETAFAIAKAIYENRQMLIEAWPHLKEFDFKAQALAAEKIGLPLHPGARRFWDSVK